MIGKQPWPETGIEGFERGFATIDGNRIHYVSGGNPNGDVVVLFPGFPQTWYAWRKILPILGKRYRVVAPDLPGQGDSDRPLSGFDTTSIAKLVSGLMVKLGVQTHHLAAHDVGAWVAYPYVSMYGKNVKSLAILDWEYLASACPTICHGQPMLLGALGMWLSTISRTFLKS